MKGKTGTTVEWNGRPVRADRLARARRAQRRASQRRWAIGMLAALGVLGLLFLVFRSKAQNASYPYQQGRPGVGQVAPAFSLPSTTGTPVSLAAFRGRTVLLYFQEGLTCQPCWNQLTSLQRAASKVRAAGIDQIVSITTDPIALLDQKVADEGIRVPVLSDPSLATSRAYHANSYGMMGTSRDGHTFILVGPDGRIRWRADYGGAPNYTMFVPVTTLLAQIRAGEHPI